MAPQLHPLQSPLTPPRRQKAHSSAPLLQRAGHASLTFQPPPRFSDASSGLLTSPTTPFEDPTSFSDKSLSFQQKQHKTRTLPSRKVNPYSFATVLKPALLNHWSEPSPQYPTATPSLTFGSHQRKRARLDIKSTPIATSKGRISQASDHSQVSTSQSEHTGDLSHLSRRSGLFETSRTLLTQFPLPPKLPQLASDSSSQGTPNEPKTPSIFLHQHYQTLDIELQPLRTPQSADSFQVPSNIVTRKYSLPKPPPRLEKPLPLLPEMADSKARTTPPRAIFKDFSTAYQSIKSKSTRNLYDGSPVQELPLPPMPAQIRPTPIRSQSESRHSTNEEESARPMAARTTTKQRVLAQMPSTKRASNQMSQWYDNEQVFLGLSQAIAGRRRRRALPIDVFTRFSMPEVSNLYDKETHDEVDLLRLQSQLGGSSSSSGDRHETDHDSHSTSAGSHDSAEDFIDSYITKPEPQRPYVSRRYSAMPRLQHVHSGLTDMTT